MDSNVPIVGGQGSENHLFMGGEDWAYHFSTASNYEDPNTQQSGFVLPTQPMVSSAHEMAQLQVAETDVDDVGRHPVSRKGKEKKVSRRGSGFTKEEDAVICSAFLNVSKDPIIGASQSQGSYYKRMHDFFNAHKPDGSVCSQLAIQGRWLLIQRAVNKFCGFKSAIDRRNESGKNEQDRIDDAVNLYEKAEPFGFLHCWRILKDHAKWNDRVLELTNSGGRKGHGSAETEPATNEDDVPSGDTVEERLEGRDTAKRRIRGESHSSSSTAVEVLQRIHDSRERSQKKEDEQLQLLLGRKDEKLHLQRELLQLRRQKTELLAKQAEAQLLTAEAGIMAIDLDKVAPHLKDYYIGMQRQIMERRGFAPSSTDDS